MNISKLTLVGVVTIAAVSAIAQNQSPFATPNGRNGRNFWFGNLGAGPSLHSSAGYDWDANNRAWFEYDGSSNSFKGAGGIAGFGQQFTNFTPGIGWNFLDIIQARTTINVRPYVYVDGYFGLLADVQGWGYAQVPLGSSTFFILHNAPVYVRFQGFTDAITVGTVGVSNGSVIPVDYSAQVYRTIPGNVYLPGVQVPFGPRSGNGLLYLDPVVDTNFFGRIDINRTATVNYNVPAGQYQSTGLVIISAL